MSSDSSNSDIFSADYHGSFALGQTCYDPIWELGLESRMLDAQTFVAFACMSKMHHELAYGKVGCSVLHAFLGSRIEGASKELAKCAAFCEKLQCHFPAGNGFNMLASDLAFDRLARLRTRLPQSIILLAEIKLPVEAKANLYAPLAEIATDSVTVATSSAVIHLSMKLKCVTAAFFKAEKPLCGLMLGVDMKIDEGSPGVPLGKSKNAPLSAPDTRAVVKTGSSEMSGGTGHRWGCVCVDVEGSGRPSLFSSAKQNYLQPSWRKPQMFHFLKGRREVLRNSQTVDGEVLFGDSCGFHSWNVAFALYRTDDANGPDLEADIF
jgi:hypothetical protein